MLHDIAQIGVSADNHAASGNVLPVRGIRTQARKFVLLAYISAAENVEISMTRLTGTQPEDLDYPA